MSILQHPSKVFSLYIPFRHIESLLKRKQSSNISDTSPRCAAKSGKTRTECSTVRNDNVTITRPRITDRSIYFHHTKSRSESEPPASGSPQKPPLEQHPAPSLRRSVSTTHSHTSSDLHHHTVCTNFLGS